MNDYIKFNERKELVHKIIDAAGAAGIPKNHIVVDGLVATIGAQPEAALDTLETIRYCKEDLGA